MFRFILACMLVVALSIFATAAQFMVSGIEGKRQEIALRNAAEQERQKTVAALQAAQTENVATLAPTETPAPSENVAANAQIPDAPSPEQLNRIESAAGDDFPKQGFTNAAPAGLKDDAPAPSAIPSATPADGVSAN